jgi:hypothetical protein
MTFNLFNLKIETCSSFDGLYVKKDIILTYSAFIGITKSIVYKYKVMINNTKIINLTSVVINIIIESLYSCDNYFLA